MKSVSEYAWPMKNPNHRPFDHQVETTYFLLRNPRAFVLNDLGTGKTLCPLWAFDILLCFRKARKMLIVTPLSTIRSVWAREIFDNFPHRKYAVAHGTREQRVAAIQCNADFVIINHDGIKSVEDEIIREKFDIVVIDESTAFKNQGNDRSKCMNRITRTVKGVWAMTAAPTPNGPTEAYGQAKIVNPGNPFLPRYFGKFRDMVEVQVAPYVWIPKPEAKKIVHQILQPSIRFERDKCLDLPPVTHQDIEIEMTRQQKSAYDAMKKELLYEYESGEISAVNAAVKLSKLLQISAGSVKDDTGKVLHLDSSNKDKVILEMFEEIGKTKLIVSAAFVASVERLAEFFDKQKIRTEYIHGGVNSNARTRIIEAFQYKDLQMLVIQPQSMSHGVTLTASSTLIHHSLVASGETYLQVNGRITRAGQTKKQYVAHLICSPAERHILNILQGKGDMNAEVLDMFRRGDL